MRKRFIALGLVAVVLIVAMSSCTWTTIEAKQDVGVYGRVFNGLTRAVINTTTDTALAGTLTYYDSKKDMTMAIDAEFSGDYYYFKKLPTNTPYVISFTGTGMQRFSSANSGVNPTVQNDGQGSNTWVVGNDPSVIKNAYLFPSDVNPGDVTIRVIDSVTSTVIDSAGTVLLTPTAASDYVNTSDSNALTNDAAIGLATVVSGTLASGTVTIPGTSLVLGADYKVEIYGVTGYEGKDNAGTITPKSASATTASYTLVTIAPALAFQTRSDFINNGTGTAQQVAAGTTITFTFSKDVELEPHTNYTAGLVTLATNPDTNGNGTVNTLAADAPVYATTASGVASVTVTGNALTITLKAFATSDSSDDFTLNLATGSIQLRVKGTTANFVTLSSVLSAPFNSATWIVYNPSNQ